MKTVSSLVCTIALLSLVAADAPTSQPKVVADFFNGKDLSNWDGDAEVWSVKEGEIVGKSETGLKKNNFIKSKIPVSDFRLTFKIKLTPAKDTNSGVQFRSIPWQGYEMKGPQADIGKTWWGSLYEESARGMLQKAPNEDSVKPEDWNTYEILAVGSKVRLAINGVMTVDLNDDKIAKEGLIALQVHSGPPTEVRFKELVLETNPEFNLKTVEGEK